MTDRSLFAIYFAYALDGLGLLALGARLGSRFAVLQSVGQIAVVFGGLALESTNVNNGYVLVWLSAILATLVGRVYLRKHMGGMKRFARLQRAQSGPAPEMLIYFALSLLINYSGIWKLCSSVAWGIHCWTFVFGSTAVLLFTLGGVGLACTRAASLLGYAVRIAVVAGLSALAHGCWLAAI